MENDWACIRLFLTGRTRWVFALFYWVATFNGNMVGKYGNTPYVRRHGEPAAYRYLL